MYVVNICDGQVFGPRSLSDSHGLFSTFTDCYHVLTDLVFTRLSTADTDSLVTFRVLVYVYCWRVRSKFWNQNDRFTTIGGPHRHSLRDPS